MISFKFLILIGLVAYLNQANGLSCKNEQGQDVDWFILIKPPKTKHDDENIKKGQGYGFIDSNSKEAGWTLSKLDIGHPNSYIGRTFTEVYETPEKYSYVQYNDAKPKNSSGSDSSIYAHAKGSVVWNNEDAVFISHSTPKFLPIFHLKKYEFPKTGKSHGQNFMCVSLNTKDNIDELLYHLVKMKVQVYANHISKQLNKEISALIQNNINILAKIIKPNKNEPEEDKELDKTTPKLISKKGKEFKLISKSRRFSVDIWSEVAPKALDINELSVKSWTLLQKITSLLTSTCNRKQKILNVMDMHILFKNSKTPVSWGKNDHSKWGLCLDEGRYCYCQGDMNRATSQFKRGGGLLCIEDSIVHETVKNSYSNEFSCKFGMHFNGTKIYQ